MAQTTTAKLLNLTLNPLKKNKNRQSSSSRVVSEGEGSPPPKSSFSSLSFASEADEFHFESPKLLSLRKQQFRQSKVSPKQRKEHFGRLTVVLDLDETLIHSKISPRFALKKAAQDRRFSSSEESTCDMFHLTLSDGEKVKVFKRPGLDEFLEKVSERYEVMVYTAGLRQYAEPLLDWLDPERRVFSHRMYRDSCLFTGGYYVKDLGVVKRCLRRTVLVDNNLCCFLPQLSNGIPISSFYDDPQDDALTVLLNFLEGLEKEADVRKTLSKSFNLEKSLGQTRDMLLG